MGRTISGVLGSLQEVFHRAGMVARPARNASPVRRRSRRRGLVDCFAAAPIRRWICGSPHRGQEAVRHLQIEDVAELVARRHRAVGQLDEPRGREKPVPPHQRFAVLLDPFGGARPVRRRSRPMSTPCRPRSRLRERALVRAEPLDLLVRSAAGRCRESPTRSPQRRLGAATAIVVSRCTPSSIR